MKALNSFGVSGTTTRVGMGVLAIAAILFLMSPLTVFAAGTTVTVNLSSTQLNVGQPLTISGAVSPAPPTGSALTVTTTNPSGQTVDISPVNINSGSYSYTYTTGGSSNWVNGTYTVTATYKDSSGVVTTGTHTFIVGTITTTATSGGSGGVTTTIYDSTTVTVMSTIVQQTTVTVSGGQTTTTLQGGQTTTTLQGGQTTTTLQGGQTTVTVSGGQTTTTVVAQTTVTQAYSGSNNGVYVGAAGVVIAIIAGALAALALRKK
ncbi:MAG: hypothetical protein ACYC7D_13900 [Nitrososphaerales archaeon]